LENIFYLDNNATTRMCDEAIEAMATVQRDWFGNASSVHSIGADARACLEEARKGIASLIGCKPSELYFTSGGTEANNWALLGIGDNMLRGHWDIFISAVEHKSILRFADYLCWGSATAKVKVDGEGVVDLDNLRSLLAKSRAPAFVSVMMANNETGIIQPVSDVVKTVKSGSAKSIVHTDAVQAFGKIPVNVQELGVDLMTISAHKLGGPKGIGALYVRDRVAIRPLLLGGHQERDYRAGTENVAAAVGFHVAARKRLDALEEYVTHTFALSASLQAALLQGLDNVWVNGNGVKRIPNTINIGFEGVESDALVLMLSERGVIVSNGSACESGSLEGSHVLKAMGRTEAESRNAIRFSVSDDLETEDIKAVAAHVIEAVTQLRAMPDVPF